ncbi:MAG: PSD1 domain-containing protein, partial [Fuerstia sp.]|nr:PSD1 domain-containing protein [Fuerstiella sp.]
SDPLLNPSQHDVIPIMLRHCTPCHGRHLQEAGLDLRNRTAMLKGGRSGPALVPGDTDKSLMIQKIHAGQMPPLERLVEASVKPVDPAETAILMKWIKLGAPEMVIAPDVATTTPDPLVSDEDRDFWAFRAPVKAAVPLVRSADRVRNPIDAFVLSGLEQQGLSLAPEADRRTLIRRASFDLTGLPPDPQEIETFLSDKDPQAYEKLIDRLLDSPRYGERWGRYWLDLAGYSDSEGKREQDLPRPHAWRYRDYVIRSFNADKPYSRFLLEQLAGDELADYQHAAEITTEMSDNLVATGFLRMAPDPTWANITGFIPDRIDVIADEIDVFGSGILGLTLKCARCHSHKFDPIPHRDYYRMVDVFKGAYDEYNWLRPEIHPGIGPVSQDIAGGRVLAAVPTSERKAWEDNNARIAQEISAAQQTPEAEAKVKSLEAQRQPEPQIQALWDRGDPSLTYIYRRGDPLSPGRLVGPGVPSVLTDGKTPFIAEPPWPGARSTGRRLALARWLTQPDHPLTSRVAVNRIWKHHFGRGIVQTLGNFGKAGTPPTHPELLDWLAVEFVEHGWSFKNMHRLMMTSATYRQSSTLTSQQESLDPDNRLISRMPFVRLDAESLFDSLLLVAGRLDETRYGPGDPVTARPVGLVTPQATSLGWRRMIYVQQQRKRLPTHLESFDYPQMNPNCIERRDSVVSPQALYLMNNGMIFELAESFATRIRKEVGSDPMMQIQRISLIAFGRLPDDEEQSISLESLTQLEAKWTRHLTSSGAADP